MPPDYNYENDVYVDNECKSEVEEYMYWLVVDEGYPRRKARRKAERKFKKHRADMRGGGE